MRSVIALVLFAACTDPIVEMQLILPKNADSFDTSCITAVEVRVNGGNFLANNKDFTSSCIEIQGGSTYAVVRDAIRGQFTVDIPDTGMSGIEVYGWSGPSSCADDDPIVSPDLLFFGRGDYIGQERVDIPLVPNLDCTRSEVKVRMFDMFALSAGATCDVAGTLQGAAGAGIGTLVPRMFGKGTEFYGRLSGANATGNLSTFMGPTQTGTKSCLAFEGGSENTGGSTSCALATPSVCAAPGETELAIVPYLVMDNASNFDTSLMVKFPGVVFGSVWSNGATKAPISNATVEVDPAHGKVVYIDPPDAMGTLGVRESTSTGPSGLFMLYTDKLASAKVTANGITRNVTLGAPSYGPGAAMIVVGN